MKKKTILSVITAVSVFSLISILTLSTIGFDMPSFDATLTAVFVEE